MSIGKSTLCLVGLLALCGRRGIAQDAKIEVEEANPLVISGFAVGLGTYDHNLSQSTALASKIAVSFFKPWSDQLYLFGQLTTHVEPQPSGPAETHIELDNLIINWTPAKVSALSLSFGRFDAPVGFERDDEPLNLVPTSSFTLETASSGEVHRPHGPLYAQPQGQPARPRREWVGSGNRQQPRQDGRLQVAALSFDHAGGGRRSLLRS